MISGVVFCPPAPFLVPGLARGLGATETRLVDACAAAIAQFDDPVHWVVLASAPVGLRVLPPGSRTRPSTLARSDQPVPDRWLPGAERSDPLPPTGVGVIVAAALLADRDMVSAIEIGPGQAGPAGSALAALTTGDRPVVLLGMADGATSHGPSAPNAQDARSADVDAGICAALAAGDPADLARWLATEAAVALEVGVRSLPVLATVAELELVPTRAALSYRAQPFGVGYFVATWST